jgi:hypothetical protein
VVPIPNAYRDALLLALLDTVVRDASNVRFGPELYVGPERRPTQIPALFSERVHNMALDLDVIQDRRRRAKLYEGDSRRIGAWLGGRGPLYDCVICSPPYPTEHDYTRNARLELAFLEAVTEKGTLQAIKRRMIRSHTKGIYAGDSDHLFASGHPTIARIASRIHHATRDDDHGFARFYPVVVLSYFGGMFRHFRSVKRLMKGGAEMAYVVSDQASYANVHIPTAALLGEMAEWAGLEVVEIRHWRKRQSTATARSISEEILCLKVPKRGEALGKSRRRNAAD